MDATARHLRLLTETIAAVNSTLDLEEVLDGMPQALMGTLATMTRKALGLAPKRVASSSTRR